MKKNKQNWWNTKTRWRLLLLNYLLGTGVIVWAILKNEIELVEHIFTEVGLVHIAYIGGDTYRPSDKTEPIEGDK